MKNKKYVLFVGLQTPRKTVKKTINSKYYLQRHVIDNFIAKTRLNNQELWQEYSDGKQTLKPTCY